MVSGLVKLALDDPADAGWKRYFAKISGLESLADVSTSPVQLVVPADCRLKIIVEDSAPSTNIRKRERSPSGAEDQQQVARSSETPSPPKKRTSQADSEDVSWLQGKLSDLSGYQDFKRDQGKKLTNKSRVVFWKFAAQFSAKYYNQTSGAPERLDKLVKKVSIETALSMGATALAEAEKMTKIIEKFGLGGEKCAQEVVDRAGVDTTEGRGFPQFLVAWEKSRST
ncbi:hypothetical protein DFH09DRAFT_1309749 [Mycena vulgaris]|nr:hypothetical protein DFH09DRAFT_1309749 [Mycena vulgaris]